MKTIVSILAMAFLGACSSSTPNMFSRMTNSTYTSYSDFVEKQELKKVDQIDELAFWDVRALDNDYVMLKVKGNKHYLLSLEDSCQGMEFDTRFGVIQQEENQLNVNDKIVRLSDKKSQCSITSIYKLYPVQFEELERMRVRSGNSRERTMLESSVRLN